MSRKKKSKAQSDVAEAVVLFSEEIISSIVNSLDPKGDLRKLIPLSSSEKEITNHIGQYLKANYHVNRDFELLLRRYYFKYYVEALKETLAFINEGRFAFLVEEMKFKIPELIGEYFLRCDSEPIKKFERIVSNLLPEIFVEKVRVHKAFLQPKRFDFYIKDERLNIPKEHLETWKYLKDTEDELWSKVEEFFKIFAGENQKLPTEADRFCSAMVEILIWMEEKRWDFDGFSKAFYGSHSRRTTSRIKLSQKSTTNNDCGVLERPMPFASQLESNELLNELLGCYSLFAERYVRDNKISVLALSEEEVQALFNEYFCSTLEKGIPSISQHLFEAILSWISFYNGVLSTYCYKMNVKPIVRSNGNLYLTESPRDYYRWKLDGCRYEINRKAYFEMGKGREKNASVLLLEDLCLDKINWKGEEIDANKVFRPMTDLSIQKYNAYEKRFEQVKFLGLIIEIKTWSEFYIKYYLKQAKTNEGLLPFFIVTKDSLFQMVKNNDVEKDMLEHFERLFDDCFCFKFDNEEFNRFKKKSYNVMDKPFLEVFPNTYFLPILFFANNDWFYGSAEKIMEMYDAVDEKDRKESSNRMEELLANLFKRYGFRTFCDHEGDKKRKGDVDIIVEGKDTALLIQLKRTKFRPNLSEQYLEAENTDNKAARQLNDYEYKGAKKKVVRWYVTNSYENCLKEFVDEENKTSCTKVNYFDLLFVLGLPERMKEVLDDPSRIYPPINKENLDEIRHLKRELQTLDGIIGYISEDCMIRGHSNWKDTLSKELGFWINGTLFPTITEPCKAYEILLKTDNTDAYERLSGIIGNNKLGDDERLRIAEVLSHAIPDDYRVWDILADIYTDKNEFGKAVECCKKALALSPKDPYLLRNYIITLNKEKTSREPYVFYQSEEEKEAVLSLLNDYWFLDLELPSQCVIALKINNEIQKANGQKSKVKHPDSSSLGCDNNPPIIK